MAAVNYRTLLIIIILIAGFMTTMGLIVTQVTSNYGIESDGNFTVLFSEMNKTLETNQQFAEKFQNSTELSSGFSLLGGEGSIANVMSSSIKMPFSQVKTAITMKDLISVKLGIPLYVLDIFVSIILIIIAVVFLSILFRTPGGV